MDIFGSTPTNTERQLLDQRELAAFRSRGLDDALALEIRERIWKSVDSILGQSSHVLTEQAQVTGLALGYVQSGKTTSIISLIAAAHDVGYKIVIGLIGSNDNLLRQNSSRILSALNIENHGRHVWYTNAQAFEKLSDEDLKFNLEVRNRTALILIMKNSAQIKRITSFLSKLDLDSSPVLIIDDEADQVSLNTLINRDLKSSTYDAISELRKFCKGNLYVQYTATPYANLLLTPDDHLAPDFVEILEPGKGYTGGYQFFVENKYTYRNIGAETSNQIPTKIAPNLEKAMANFFVGATLMIGNEGPEYVIPISMLINPHQKNLVQDGYKQILDDRIKLWSQMIDNISEISQLPAVFASERQDLVGNGVPDLEDALFLDILKECFRNCKVWLMNQSTSGLSIKWEEYPLHILLGANKLDRGFTVEGLTVTYMSRKPSDQIDTMQQRSRAYGYRPYIRYCRIFTTKESKQRLIDTVTTEEDLREQLRIWIALGRNFKEWAKEIGLIIKGNTKPTRDSVVKQLKIKQIGIWHFLLNSPEGEEQRNFNEDILRNLDLFNAPYVDYGSHSYRTIVIDSNDVFNLVAKWQSKESGGWNAQSIKRYLQSIPGRSSESRKFKLVLIDTEELGQSRTRTNWFGTYFLKDSSQLMQGRNSNYPGDRDLFLETENVLQVHRIKLLGEYAPDFPVVFLALKIGNNWKTISRGDN